MVGDIDQRYWLVRFFQSIRGKGAGPMRKMGCDTARMASFFGYSTKSTKWMLDLSQIEALTRVLKCKSPKCRVF